MAENSQYKGFFKFRDIKRDTDTMELPEELRGLNVADDPETETPTDVPQPVPETAPDDDPGETVQKWQDHPKSTQQPTQPKRGRPRGQSGRLTLEEREKKQQEILNYLANHPGSDVIAVSRAMHYPSMRGAYSFLSSMVDAGTLEQHRDQTQGGGSATVLYSVAGHTPTRPKPNRQPNRRSQTETPTAIPTTKREDIQADIQKETPKDLESLIWGFLEDYASANDKAITLREATLVLADFRKWSRHQLAEPDNEEEAQIRQ